MAATKQRKSFALGYSLVVQSFITYFLFGGLTTSGMNVWAGAFSSKFGWANGTLLTLATVASLIGVIGSILFGILVSRYGARWIIAITIIAAGIAVIFFGFINRLGEYLLCMALFNFFGHGFCNIGSNAVIGNWFPRRKGFILGIATMGMPGSAFLFVQILNRSIGAWGITMAFVIIGICIAIIGVVSIFWVKDTPEEVGLRPDNGKYDNDTSVDQLPAANWNIKKVLTDGNAWLIAIIFGCLFLVNQGMVSQTVAYLMERGFEQGTAVNLLSMAALIGIAGSFIWGILDQRTNTRTATICYAIWYGVTFVLMFINGGTALCIVAMIFLGCSLGGVGNLMPSMILGVYGPQNFPRVSTVIITIVNIIRSFAFATMALGFAMFGSYRRTTMLLLAFIVLVLICTICVRPARSAKHIEEADAAEAAK